MSSLPALMRNYMCIGRENTSPPSFVFHFLLNLPFLFCKMLQNVCNCDFYNENDWLTTTHLFSVIRGKANSTLVEMAYTPSAMQKQWIWADQGINWCIDPSLPLPCTLEIYKLGSFCTRRVSDRHLLLVAQWAGTGQDSCYTSSHCLAYQAVSLINKWKGTGFYLTTFLKMQLVSFEN